MDESDSNFLDELIAQAAIPTGDRTYAAKPSSPGLPEMSWRSVAAEADRLVQRAPDNPPAVFGGIGEAVQATNRLLREAADANQARPNNLMAASELRPPPEHDDKQFHWIETSDGPHIAGWTGTVWSLMWVEYPIPAAQMAALGHRYLGPAEWQAGRDKLRDAGRIAELIGQNERQSVRISELERANAWPPSKIAGLQHHVTTLEAANAALRAKIAALAPKPAPTSQERRDAGLVGAIRAGGTVAA